MAINANTLNTLDVDLLLKKIVADLSAHLQQKNITQFHIIGIQTGGAWIAEQLHQMLKQQSPLGTLNITFYRDDFTQKGLHPSVEPSDLPFAIEGEHLILVDDVIMSGRTIRAALNELFDYGRPASVTLVALMDLNARELPIQADIIGEEIALSPDQRVKLSGPQPLQLSLQQRDNE